MDRVAKERVGHGYRWKVESRRGGAAGSAALQSIEWFEVFFLVQGYH